MMDIKSMVSMEEFGWFVWFGLVWCVGLGYFVCCVVFV